MTLPVYQPMLATRWTRVTTEPGWVHEVKWDGVRAIVSGDGSMHSRNGNRIDDGYPELEGVVPANAVVDGEIVALDSEGRPSFQVLQSRMHVRRPPSTLVREVPVTLMVFDLLYLDETLVDLPWQERRTRLEALDLPPPVVVTDVTDDGQALFDAVVALGLEGIVSKRSQSAYRPGRRSDDWRKLAHRRTCEAVVIGSSEGTGGRRSTFGSLALGLWDGGVLRYVGSVGSGFDHATLLAVDEALVEMQRDDPPPMVDADAVPRPVRWVEPALVAVVEFAEWTADGRLRAPVFKGFSSTPPDQLTWDREGPA
ncbi:MAG: non-homologous end-joining DNA ligase [Acidimicrobiia bacterium]|nr:non-homologous end-joining DNA ligase [Acidimicrobiia bacterium]